MIVNYVILPRMPYCQWMIHCLGSANPKDQATSLWQALVNTKMRFVLLLGLSFVYRPEFGCEFALLKFKNIVQITVILDHFLK